MIIISILMIIVGFLIRLVSIKTLNKNFHWRIKPPEKFIKDGIYKYIRHPMYLGTIFMYGGFVLVATSNILLTLVIMSIKMNFVLDRIDREEWLMVGIFGDEYLDYCKDTPLLIPKFKS